MGNDRYQDYPDNERRITSQPRNEAASGASLNGAGRSSYASGRNDDSGGTTGSRAPSSAGQYGGYTRNGTPAPRGSSSAARYDGNEQSGMPGSRRPSYGDPSGYERTNSSANRGTTGSSSGVSRSAATSGSGGSRGYGSSGNSSGGSSGGPKKKKKKRRYRLRIQPRAFFILSILLVIVAMIVVGIRAFSDTSRPQEAQASQKPGLFAEIFKTPTPSPTPTPEPTPTPSPTPPYEIPHAVDSTQPSVLGLTTAIEVDGTKVDTYERAEKIEFLPDEPYSSVAGVITFRGNNYRDSAAYGTASISNRRLSEAWKVETGELMRSDIGGATETTWTGSGWVGQPLIVQWPENIKQFMNMHDWAKQKAGLVEVILGTMDGNIYFLDLETGQQTRNILRVGMPFKGAGSLDPRGYPILYIGSGDMYVSDEMKARAMVYSLIDFTRLYEFGKQNDSFALRDWHAYDSAPLVDAKTDTLIYPGENGILYTIKLNTTFDEMTGQLGINPSEIVKMRYVGARSTYPASTNTADNKYWLGYETSIAVLGEFGYLGTNDGFLQCINLNTMSLIWAQDTQDDTNSSPVLETDFANRAAYLYIGSSLHFTADAENLGSASFYKVNAITGEIMWKHSETVNTRSGVSGGVQGTALLGQKSISDLVIVPFARTPNKDDGVLLALDKATGAVRWTFLMEKYTWSSPVAVYDASGNAYIIICEGSDTGGKVFLLDGKTGTLLSSFDAEKNIEASPAVYGNMIVFGTRGMKIWGVKIS
ncbi:MAG: PQQ-binding-like beta-propeller repeat protein [Eubacteriales bacterium]|jgi:hypothetical protein|nr:PQQ-binding-like beta-propeller repeat protein [Eubacteriales bacterium]